MAYQSKYVKQLADHFRPLMAYDKNKQRLDEIVARAVAREEAERKAA